ncbi:hypothetical protein ABIB57_001624 [Devosia sp. UYZn731]|uniref:hypothetical protein n=1 Tax=Devosia sp. UYZn731 TaxID=3156345 RepID=UPI003391B127
MIEPIHQSRFPWWVYWTALIFILAFTIAPFFLMVADSGLGILLIVTAPLGMGALIVWGIVVTIHRLAWGRHNKPSP